MGIVVLAIVRPTAVTLSSVSITCAATAGAHARKANAAAAIAATVCARCATDAASSTATADDARSVIDADRKCGDERSTPVCSSRGGQVVGCVSRVALTNTLTTAPNDIASIGELDNATSRERADCESGNGVCRGL